MLGSCNCFGDCNFMRLYVCLWILSMDLYSQPKSSNAKCSANCLQVEAAVGAALFACKSLHGAAASQRV